MAATRPQRAKRNPKHDASYYCKLGEDKEGFDVKYINSFKGRGVFSCRPFEKGDFLIEYRGDFITEKEQQNRLAIYHDALKVFLFDFQFNGKQLCVDAAKEDGSLGRLVNDDDKNPNSKMKVIRVDGRPHLCLFALKNIAVGEEITYNYGDSDWPWRKKTSIEMQSPAADADARSSFADIIPKFLSELVGEYKSVHGLPRRLPQS
ncbi:N-lysine methyltransferase KMT5A-A-like isoform X2 [Melanotaenia boesemani]|uniref:N-lysine methyltransferase KMT5A-A-like isoform X2 n=1 Tax=Melanotaenia boesemani TaxID=1250792 RepID=UPI001C05698D|nr:N-lysine methyltransferase KMT5A-A-like isoform X2 [Melanotaenia boesemani]